MPRPVPPHQRAGSEALNTPWFSVTSSNVLAIQRQGRNLGVKFGRFDKPTTEYVYYGAGYLFAEMRNAPSKGKFVWYRLRGKFDYDGPL